MHQELDPKFVYLSLTDYLLKSRKYCSKENLQLLIQPPYFTHLPPIDLVYPGTRLSKSRSRKEGQPPRPQNGFIIFKKDFDARRRSLLSDTKVDSKVTSQIAASLWHSDEGLKKYFNLLAKLAKQIYEELYPDYDYKPKKCLSLTVRESQQASPLRIRQHSAPYEKRTRKNVVRNSESSEIACQEFGAEVINGYENGYDAIGQTFPNENIVMSIVARELDEFSKKTDERLKCIYHPTANVQVS